MKLLTYRINQKKEDRLHKFRLLSALYIDLLENDPLWHYFLDPKGGTLRVSPNFEKKVTKWLKLNCKNYNLTFQKRFIYEPKKHEYYGVAWLGDYILPLFHDMSVLMTIFPPNISFHPVHERLNHGLVNMLGLHDFVAEAMVYINLAEGRAGLVGQSLKLPKWVYESYFKICQIYKNLFSKH